MSNWSKTGKFKICVHLEIARLEILRLEQAIQAAQIAVTRMEGDLDDEFKQVISKMKPHAERLPQKSEERSKVTVWIKKLLAVKNQKTERNEYAKLLLHMMKSGKLEAPFSGDPPYGSLLRLNTFKPISTTTASYQQSLGTYQPAIQTSSARAEERSSTKGTSGATGRFESTSHSVPTARTHTGPRHSRTHSRKSKSRDLKHSEDSKKSTASPLYLIQTNLPATYSYGQEANGGDAVHAGGHRLWDSGPLASSATQRYQYVPQSPPLGLNTSAQLEDLLSSSPSLSDDVLGSDDSQLSDVSELLMGRTEHWTKATRVPVSKESFTAPLSHSPRKSFTSSLLLAESPRKLDITREILQSREVELKVKAAENRFEEEKLKIQKSHEESLKQIFDRKNNEIENLRTECRIKESQLSAQIMRLEGKLSQALKENKQLREDGSKSLVDLRQYRQKLETQFDDKLHAMVSDFEQSKLELEQHHAKAHQRLVQETSTHMAALKEDNIVQRKADAEVVSKLKSELQEMGRESESITQSHHLLQQDKVTLEERCCALKTELQTTQERYLAVEGQLSSLREDKEQQLKELRAKAEQSVQSMQNEYTIQESKMCEVISELKEQVSEMEREMERVRQEHSLRVTELESEAQRSRRQRDLVHEKQLIELKREMSERDMLNKDMVGRLEGELKARDEQLEGMRVTLEAQSRQAEQAIDDFKSEVEQQTSGMFDQMRGELTHLEKELKSCRSQRDTECQQFTLEREQDRVRMECERGELEKRHQQALEEVVGRHRLEVDSQREALERDKEEVVAKLSSQLSQLEAQSKARETHYSKVISTLEAEVKGHREQLEAQSHAHSTELEEREQRAREEGQTAMRIHEAAVSKLKTQLENQKARLREEHKREVASLNEKHERRLCKLEHEYSLKDTQSTETVSSLKAQVQFLEENLDTVKQSHEDHMTEVMRRNEEEMTSLKHHNESIRKSLQQEAEAAHLTVSQHQERTKHVTAEHSSKLSQLKLSYEERLRGMIPASMKQEYEATIKSLKSQISILQQRAGVLQEELSQRYSTHRQSPLKHRTGHP